MALKVIEMHKVTSKKMVSLPDWKMPVPMEPIFALIEIFNRALIRKFVTKKWIVLPPIYRQGIYIITFRDKVPLFKICRSF